MEVGLIRKVDIDAEMQQSYLDYAMSVIVSRALPDARDGLKPVQRRILYAMYDMGLRSDSAYKKSARIVGEVLGKYHPHGDMAVYESMARLAQDFSMRYPLVDGQGNFGSVDGDPPAAMRYTEARLMPFAMELLSQLDRETVDFTGNFDETMREPIVLPAAAPNLLVNGASGIAVGMATNIPPHNLIEVIDAIVFMLHEWEHLDDVNISDLMNFIQGPDFPTGGIILEENGQNNLHAAYATGRGRVIVRGRVHSEDMGRGRSRLIITEIPYMTNKSSLIERIAELVRGGELEGIADLRDESDRQGMRIVIEISKAAETDEVLRKLYRHTPLQTTFGIALLALVNNEPHLLTLKQALRVYIEHRLEVVRRRSEFDLKRAKQRAHILDGLRIAISNLDEIIPLIRNSPDVETARARLIKRFKLSDLQAQAILDMPLRRLAALERKKIEEEYKELQKTIKELEALLSSPKRMRLVVEDELIQVKTTFGDRRRTQIVTLKEGESGKVLLTANDLTPAKEVWVGVTPTGMIARTETDKEPDALIVPALSHLLKTNTHHTLYIVTPEGRAAGIAVEALPVSATLENGFPLYKAAPFTEKDKVQTIFTLPPRENLKEDMFVLTVSQAGLVKKTNLNELPGPSTQLFTIAKVNERDAIIRVVPMAGNASIFLLTEMGMGIRFSQQEVRSMGLIAAGVNGIKLKGTDRVIAADAPADGDDLLLLASDGKGWRLRLDEFPIQGRYGQGVSAGKLGKNERMLGCMSGDSTQAGLVSSATGVSRMILVDAIRSGKRANSGVQAIRIEPGETLVGLSAIFNGVHFGLPKETKPKAVKKGLSNGAAPHNGSSEKSPKSQASGDGKSTKKTGPKTSQLEQTSFEFGPAAAVQSLKKTDERPVATSPTMKKKAGNSHPPVDKPQVDGKKPAAARQESANKKKTASTARIPGASAEGKTSQPLKKSTRAEKKPADPKPFSLVGKPSTPAKPKRTAGKASNQSGSPPDSTKKQANSSEPIAPKEVSRKKKTTDVQKGLPDSPITAEKTSTGTPLKPATRKGVLKPSSKAERPMTTTDTPEKPVRKTGTKK